MSASGISKPLRFEILRRDGHRCRYCGVMATTAEIVIDHVIPRTLGGTNAPENLVASCTACNSGKASSGLGGGLSLADRDPDAHRWARAIHLASTARAKQRENVDAVVNWFDQAWSHHRFQQSYGERYRPAPRPNNWPVVIELLWCRGLAAEEMHRLLNRILDDRSIGSQRSWQRFLDACWSAIGNLEQAARDTIEGGFL